MNAIARQLDRPAPLATAAFLIAALLSCGAEQTPKTAADSFYRAVQERDEKAILALCDSLGGTIPLDNFLFGIDVENPQFMVPPEAIPEIHEDLAVVPTVLDNATNPLRFRTFLVAQQGGWKVLMAFTGTDMKASLLRQYVAASDEAIRGADHKLQESLESGNQQAADAIGDLRDGMLSSRDELQRQLLTARSILQSLLRSRFPSYELPPLEAD